MSVDHQINSGREKYEFDDSVCPVKGRDMAKDIPDCLFAQVLQYTAVGVESQATQDLEIIYQDTRSCGGDAWCDAFIPGSDKTPYLCKSSSGLCSDTPAWKASVSRESKISNGVLKDWIGVTITGHPLISGDGPDNIDAYFELPLKSVRRSDSCGIGNELAGKYHDCYRLDYGGWFGGQDCDKWSYFTSVSKNSQFEELKKEDAVSKHEVF